MKVPGTLNLTVPTWLGTKVHVTLLRVRASVGCPQAYIQGYREGSLAVVERWAAWESHLFAP